MQGRPDTDRIRETFIERMGLVAQGEGMPRSAGRVFALLIFDGEPIAFGDLALRLQMSRASVSTSVRFLEERGMVKRVTRPGDRQDYFQIATGAFQAMIVATRGRIDHAREEIDMTVAELPRGQGDVRVRLQEYSHFYAAISDGLGVAFTKLQDEKADEE